MQPKVGIILVNYNGYEDTIECIESLKKITYENYDIIVVDNASTEKPNDNQIKFLCTHAIVINSKDNQGFSGGNNIGIEYAKINNFDYVLLLNNDTTVEPNFLDVLVTCALNNPQAGIICGKIRYFYEPNKIWFAGGTFNMRTCVAAHRCWNEIDNEREEHIDEVTFATGCLQLIPIETIKVVGLLSEEYFLYSEDTDYCCRIIKEGYKIVYTNKAVIYHKINSTTGTGSFLSQYYTTRNSLQIIKKYSTNRFISYSYFLNRTFREIINGKKKISIVVRACVDSLKGCKGKYNGNL